MLKILLFSLVVSATPKKAHVHGEGDLNIAFDGPRGKLEFSLPGQAIFGFEHEAKSKKDRAAKDAGLKKLSEQVAEMVVFPPELGCEIKQDIFEVNQSSQHSNVNADFNVVCQKPVSGAKLTFHFQKVFARLKKVNVTVLVDNVQKSATATKDGESLELK